MCFGEGAEPSKGGSAPRNTEVPSKLHLLQQFAVVGTGEGNQIRSSKGHAIYVGISNPTSRIDGSGDKLGVKKEEKKFLLFCIFCVTMGRGAVNRPDDLTRIFYSTISKRNA